jgi:hypothetical protein
MNLLRPSLPIAAMTVAVVFSMHAQAGIELKATDGTTTITADDSSSPGYINYSGAIGNFTVNAYLGFGFPAIGSPADAVLDLTSADITSDKGGTLTVSLSETGFAAKTAATQFLSSIVGNFYIHSHATMDTYLDTTDAYFGMGTPLATGLLDNQAALVSLPSIAGPYSLTEIITINAGAHSLTSLDAIVFDAPEPTTLSLFGAGFLGLAFFGWRHRLRAARHIAAATA